MIILSNSSFIRLANFLSWSQLFVIQLSIIQSVNCQFTIQCQLSFSWTFSGQSIILDAQLEVMDNATTSSLIERRKTSTSSSRRLLKNSRLLTNVISSLRVSKRGGVPGHAANYPWVPLNPRYLGTAMQDHQSLKTIRTEIKNVLMTEFFKDHEPTVQESPARARSFKVTEGAVEARR